MLEMKDLYGKKSLESKPPASSPATFSHTNPLNISKKKFNCCQTLYSNATDIKLGSSTYFFLLFSFLVFTKCQVLNLRVGRSHGS